MARASVYEIEKAVGNDSSNGGTMVRERGGKLTMCIAPPRQNSINIRTGNWRRSDPRQKRHRLPKSGGDV